MGLLFAEFAHTLIASTARTFEIWLKENVETTNGQLWRTSESYKDQGQTVLKIAVGWEQNSLYLL